MKLIMDTNFPGIKLKMDTNQLPRYKTKNGYQLPRNIKLKMDTNSPGI
jgi:hypothetical protein